MQTILLVEDDEQLSHACARILTRAGYGVITAGNGDTAVEMFKQTQIDLLVADMFLPGKDGYEVIDACRRIRPNLPIVGISDGGGVSDPRSLLQGARELGAMVTIAKPFSDVELLSVVDQVLRPTPKGKDRWNVLDLIRKPKGGR